MSSKGFIMTGLALGLGWVLCQEAQAWPHFFRRSADKNHDGQVGPVERKKAVKVDTPWEARADRDNDGKVEPGEAHRAAVVGKAKVNRPWEAHADVNQDGRVSPGELRKYWFTTIDVNQDGKIQPAERQAHWAQRKCAVNTPIEKKFDANGDGFLTGDEASDFLKGKLRVISTGGRAIVNNPLEQDFDADNDGILSVEEAEAIREAVGS